MKRRWVTVGIVALCAALAASSYPLMNARTFQLFGGLTHRVDASDRIVALTFDDGPTCADVDAILAALGPTKGTFFLNGEPMRNCADGAKKLVQAGHQLGNHTQTHRRMVGVTPETVENEIEPDDRALHDAGVTGDIPVRPPYGKKLVVFPWWLNQHQRNTIMWDVEPENFYDGAKQDASSIVQRTVNGVRPGSIVLLHPWGGRHETQRAIPQIIARLSSQGYSFVTVRELLNHRKR